MAYRIICMYRLTGEFYGRNPPEANLELVSRFFEKYPSYADKAFLSVKVHCQWVSFDIFCFVQMTSYWIREHIAMVQEPVIREY